jgi:SAM-dependent methyltransferase
MSSQVNNLSGARRTGSWRGFEGVYANLGSPLLPSVEDRHFLEYAICEWVAAHPGETLQALLLGVTPGLAGISWPQRSFLLAVDRSESMIASVWPGNVPSIRGAIRADWLALPVRDRSLDLVAGDGSRIALRYPDGYRTLARAIRSVLRPGGVLVLRAFVRPPVAEDPGDVIAELPRHASFHQFKLRLLMALQASPEEGVQLDHAHRYWTACNIDRAALALETGWRREEIDTMDRYRGLDDVYTFPTIAELLALTAEFFAATSIFVPSYPLGECCPSLVMQP